MHSCTTPSATCCLTTWVACKIARSVVCGVSRSLHSHSLRTLPGCCVLCVSPPVLVRLMLCPYGVSIATSVAMSCRHTCHCQADLPYLLPTPLLLYTTDMPGGKPSYTTLNNLLQVADMTFCGFALKPHGPHCLFVSGLDISKETMAAIRQLAHQLLRVNPVTKCPVTCDATFTNFTRLASYSAVVLKDNCDLKSPCWGTNMVAFLGTSLPQRVTSLLCGCSHA